MNSNLNPILKGPQSSNRGFTLLELLVVLVIIGLLASFVGPRYFGQLAKSEAKVAKAQLVGLEKALDHTVRPHRSIGRRPPAPASWDIDSTTNHALHQSLFPPIPTPQEVSQR